MPRRSSIALALSLVVFACFEVPPPAGSGQFGSDAGVADTIDDIASRPADTSGADGPGPKDGGEPDEGAPPADAGQDAAIDALDGDGGGAEDGDGGFATDPDACTPDCAGRECGPDGCDGLCGICIIGEVCNALGQCGPPCEAICDGKFCGDDGCGGSCGKCPTSYECGPDGKCYDVSCEPDCTGKVCGGNGCGGSCGDCVNNDICVEGACVAGPCSGIPKEGKCEDGVLWLCVDGAAVTKTCADTTGMVCGFSPVVNRFDCVASVVCEPQCAGKECGEDGCGGACGTCPSGWPCQVGICKPEAGGGCGYYTPVGTCDGAVLWYCSEKKLFVKDCSKSGKACGFEPAAGVNKCLD